jgi:hypothetical protein
VFGNSSDDRGVYTHAVNRHAIGVSLVLVAVIGATLTWRHYHVAVLAPSELRSTQPNPIPPHEPVKVEDYSQARSKPCDRGEASPPLPELRVELKPSEDGVLLFSPKLRHHLHFLLFSNKAGLKVYEDWNSWGYFAPSFKAEDETCKTYNITRRERDWDKNFPSTTTLNKGDFLIIDTYLCDETWRVLPKLPTNPESLTLQVRGHFAMKADKRRPISALWTGQAESAPLEIYLDNQCIEVLNAEP